jgi:hypothetical protein
LFEKSGIQPGEALIGKSLENLRMPDTRYKAGEIGRPGLGYIQEGLALRFPQPGSPYQTLPDSALTESLSPAKIDAGRRTDVHLGSQVSSLKL